jgi:DNA-binding GntR family transcriptional regulator
VSVPATTPLGIVSVVDLVYRELRTRILRGDIEPGQRLAQAELADSLGVSRTPVREALRRLTGEGLVEFRTNYGFSVAETKIGGMLHRMEVRAILEPRIAELAAERRSQADLEEMQAAIDDERKARSPWAAHDASRRFHIALARATGNEELVRCIDGLWIVEVGRWALARRRESRKWQQSDAAEHGAVAAAVAAGRSSDARRLMEEHLKNALVHWEPVYGATGQTGKAAAS